MKTVNLKKIIEEHGLEEKDIAQELFPENKYPKLALARVVAEKAVLDSNQISKLSLISGIPIGDLYNQRGWKATTSKDKLNFTSGEYTAELNTKTWITKIYHNKSLFHDSIIHEKGIALNDYLELLSNVISKHNK